jgi:DNA-directed RNA polymerase subunit RPC12/RpoP
MRYVCLNCGNRWEIEDGKEDKKIRCPSCMRVTGIEKIADAKRSSASPTQSPWLVPGVAAALIAAAAGGYAIWRSSAPAEVGEDVPSGPLEHDVLLGHLRRLHVDARGVSNLVEPDEAIEALAEDATEDRDTPTEMAEGAAGGSARTASGGASTRSRRRR